MTSPFRTHRDKILGHYSTAAWLRSVVMALWNGADHPVALNRLHGLDDAHYAAFIDLVSAYRRTGQNDLAFRHLVEEIKVRVAQEQAAEQHDREFQEWRLDVARSLRQLGKPVGLTDDRYNWLEARFDAGDAPETAARACPMLTDPEIS